MRDTAVPVEIQLSADNPDDIDALYDGLRGTPGIRGTAASPPAAPGDQGAAFDVLTVALSSGAITALLQIIKVIAESRGPKFSLKIRQGKNKLEVKADNVDEVIPAIRDLLEGP
jgi:hypothetical protein